MYTGNNIDDLIEGIIDYMKYRRRDYLRKQSPAVEVTDTEMDYD